MGRRLSGDRVADKSVFIQDEGTALGAAQYASAMSIRDVRRFPAAPGTLCLACVSFRIDGDHPSTRDIPRSHDSAHIVAAIFAK